MSVLVLAKLVVAPAFVVAVTLLGRRLGPSVAGMLAALPVVGGPILALIVAEQGVAFGSEAALAGAVGGGTTMVFTLVYTRLAPRFSPLACLALSYAFWGVATAALSFLPIGVSVAVALPLALWWLVLRAFPVPDGPLTGMKPSAWDLPARAAATMALVLSITGVASALGPQLAGLVTPAPIATAVLAVFTHRQAGPDAVAVLLRSLTRGLASFTSFFVMTGLLLPVVSPLLAFSLALCVALVVQAAVLKLGVGLPHRPVQELAPEVSP
jgi:hypothetical protein